MLELVGIPKLSNATPRGGMHVEFVSVDKCKVIPWPYFGFTINADIPAKSLFEPSVCLAVLFY